MKTKNRLRQRLRKRNQQRRRQEALLGNKLNERVYTSNFRTRQHFGAASPVKYIEVTEDLKEHYTKLYKK